MKKFLALMLAVICVFSLAACGKESGSDADVEVAVADATELLTTVWDTYEESESFYAMGGDYVTIVDNAPGKFDISDAESLDSMLGVPADAVGYIDDAASLVHAMNANTFTGGAYHLSDAGNQQAFADALKENIINRQWMCGFPDKLIIVAVGDEYVVSAFGAADIIDTFKTKLSTSYGVATVLYEENLAE